jgi:pyruvate/2-oxoglutarate dehydrogenase complex dihydrolipoamide dehydrogenase (E3) component
MTPTPLYDLIIIGGGTTGLTAAQAALALGARTAMIEGKRTGGECTWTGCIPSKALLKAAHLAETARKAHPYGIHVDNVQVDFAAVMAQVRQTIHDIYHEESPDALRKQGLDVYEAHARFIDSNTIALADGRQLRGKKFIIGTGAQPIIPAAFRDTPYLTTETLFDLDVLPTHLIIVGGGATGCEMAQAFRRLGAQVTLIEQQARILPNVDDEAAASVRQQLLDDGITLYENCAVERAHALQAEIQLNLSNNQPVTGDKLLLAVGKRPQLDSLNLTATGVETRDGLMILDERLQTSQRHIYAAGDVTGSAQYTHYAGWQAFIAVRNALLPAPLGGRGVRNWTPYALFTEPEVAQAGMTEAQARAKHGAQVHITQLPMTRADRAMTEGKRAGFMKLVHLPSGKLLGATIVGYNASEMINDWIAVLERGGNVSSAASAMRVYPSLGTANVILATEQVKAWLGSSITGRVLRTLRRLTP